MVRVHLSAFVLLALLIAQSNAFLPSPRPNANCQRRFVEIEKRSENPSGDSTFQQGRIENGFRAAKERREAAFITYFPAGYPTGSDTPAILMAMQEGGASVIELGIPYSDPQADGPTIQRAHMFARKNGTTKIRQCLEMLKESRRMGLTVPVVLMSYYNPLLQYGVAKLCQDASEAGVDGFIAVDLPPEEAGSLNEACLKTGMSNIPLITPMSTEERIEDLVTTASTFLYCVSVTGVTGVREKLPTDLTKFVERVRSKTGLPLAVGFGVSSPEMVNGVANIADGVVVGSKILKALDHLPENSTSHERATAIRECVAHLKRGTKQSEFAKHQAATFGQIPALWRDTGAHHRKTRFGRHGGQFIPEIVVPAFAALEANYAAIQTDPGFARELDSYRRDFVGGPTPLQKAERLTQFAGGATIWLKREDLSHTGSHHINNAIGHVLLAKRMGMTRIVAETGSGQHGVATATICAKLGLECVIYMGVADCERQRLNVLRIEAFGAKVVPVAAGQGGVKEAMSEAIRDSVANVRNTYCAVGSAIGPHPYPTMVRDFQSIMGKEIRAQMVRKAGKLPDAVVACVGGGSNAIGVFHPFVGDESVALYGVEAVDSAPLANGTPGVLHGASTYILQDESGQTLESHSIAAGMAYPAAGPEHAYLKDIGRATYGVATDEEAATGFRWMCEYEGIIPSLETSHAIFYAVKLAKTLGPGKDLVINMSGRGDKDVALMATSTRKSVAAVTPTAPLLPRPCCPRPVDPGLHDVGP